MRDSSFAPLKSKTYQLTVGGILAALVFVCTYFLKLPVPMSGGYVHLGDGVILLGASAVGMLCVPGAAVGSLLADLLLGWPAYAIPTFLIKGGVAAVAAFGSKQKNPWLWGLWLVLAEGVMAAGYFLVEWLVLGYGFAGAFGNVPGNLLQGGSGIVLAFLLAPALRRVLKQK